MRVFEDKLGETTTTPEMLISKEIRLSGISVYVCICFNIRQDQKDIHIYDSLEAERLSLSHASNHHTKVMLCVTRNDSQAVIIAPLNLRWKKVANSNRVHGFRMRP